MEDVNVRRLAIQKDFLSVGVVKHFINRNSKEKSNSAKFQNLDFLTKLSLREELTFNQHINMILKDG